MAIASQGRAKATAIDSANAVFNSTGAVGQGWTIDFTLTPEGRGAFADATTRLSASNDQLAIVVDREVISAPRTNGSSARCSGLDELFGRSANGSQTRNVYAGSRSNRGRCDGCNFGFEFADG